MIRARDFAKIKFSRSTESLTNPEQYDAGAEAVARDSDVITVSSCEEKPQLSVKKEPKPRKKRERKPKVPTTPTRKVRKWKTPLKANYSKITDFFQKTKNDGIYIVRAGWMSIFIISPLFQPRLCNAILRQ